MLLLGIGLAVVQFLGMSRRLAGMSRALMPGTATVQLAAGETPFYAELESEVNGAVVKYPPGQFECVPSDPAAATLSRSSTKVNYSLGGFTGELVFVANAKQAAEVSVSCTGTSFVLAWGVGVGAGIVAAVGSAFGGVALALIIAIITWRRRRAWSRAQQAPR